MRSRSFRFYLNVVDIVWCSLIYEVVKPVGEHQSADITPGDDRLFGGIVIREVVVRYLNVETSLFVAEVLFCKSVCIVLAVTCSVEVTALKVRYKVDTRLLGVGEYL